jgi:UDP-N-acetylglucosamine-lysosomal-enzyme
LVGIDSGKVKLVSHDSLFPEEYQQYLPTFNSFAVDAHVDRVPGLSEQFLLMRDNQFFGRHVFK